MVMFLLQTSLMMSKNTISKEKLINVNDDIIDRFFDLLPPCLGILIIGGQQRA
jgi:hypothetical protein